jgi:hypothetical protein
MNEKQWIQLRDKGNHVNIGVVAKSEQAFHCLRSTLTAESVHRHFHELGVTKVTRYELPRVHALNFVLYDALAGGASASLRIDTQGKLIGTAILDMQLPVDEREWMLLRGNE